MCSVFLEKVTKQNVAMLREYFKAFYIEGKRDSREFDENLFAQDFAFFCSELIKNGDETNKDGKGIWITYYIAYGSEEEKIVGMGEIRHALFDDFEESVGNVGYSVVERERRKGYGREILKALMEQGRLWRMESFHIACQEENIPSNKIILGCGGELVQKRKDKSHNICYYKLLL